MELLSPEGCAVVVVRRDSTGQGEASRSPRTAYIVLEACTVATGGEGRETGCASARLYRHEGEGALLLQGEVDRHDGQQQNGQVPSPHCGGVCLEAVSFLHQLLCMSRLS